MTAWISPAQQRRDHNGQRNTCAACGHDSTANNPLVVDVTDGMRVHRSHFDDPRSGYYGEAFR